MQQTNLKIALAALFLAGSTSAMAIPFASFETRSMGMGGVGVAIGSPDAAPLFNPALLSVSKPEDDFSLILPTIGVGVGDPSKLRDAVDAFNNGNYLNNLQTSINTFNNAPTVGNATTVTNNINTVSTQLTTLSNRPITVDGGAAVVASIPSKSFGMSFYADAHVATGGQFKYNDAATLSTLSNNVSLCAATPGNNVPCNYVAAFNTNNLTSGILFRGVALGEMGVAMSHEFDISDSKIAFAITPKIVKAQLFDAQLKVSDSNTNSSTNVTGSDFLAEYSFANFDIGAAKLYEDSGWRTGIVIKNVIPHTLDFKSKPVGTPAGTPQIVTGQLNLKPQARIGVSHSTSWSTVGLDIDLTRNDPAGFEQGSQYVALGGELDAFGWAQLRAGYRMNLVDSARNVYSLGLGFALFGVVHADVAAAANADEAAASVQLGVHF